jgi:DNA mismatch repair ATPase MutS
VKAFLLHRDRDFDLDQEPPPGAADLVQDLELETLFNAMAGGDRFLLEVARQVVLAGLEDVSEVLYRQDVLRDCLRNAAIVRGLYALTVETIERERKNYWGLFSKSPGFILHRSVDVLQMFVEVLRRLRREAEVHADKFESDGFRTLFATLQRELDDAYLGIVEAHLARLKFRHGVLLSARLGKGNTGTNYVLRKPHDDDRPWIQRLLTRGPPAYTFRIHERDESGARALAELRDRGINLVANAAAQSNDHILSFFRMLRTELAFYVGCVNLYEKLSAKGAPTAFPTPVPATERRHTANDLYDVCLELTIDGRVIGNDLAADGKDLFMITGANQGGKSTFLRSIGLAQLMMQSGMFVPARSYCANLCAGLFTHYKREEDVTMRAGKFEEELQRISGIVDQLVPDCLVLFNESFQSTNEREGSEIGRQIVAALLESRVKVFFVTHMYDLAGSLHDRRFENAMFLRAEWREDGTRTFKVLPGAPLPTSHGKDLYDQIFETEAAYSSGSGKRSDHSGFDVAPPGRRHDDESETVGPARIGGRAP